MSGMADDRAAYLEAVHRAEEAAGITRDDQGEEVYAAGEPPVATTELDGAVPITASDQPLTPESAVAPPVVAADTSGEQQEAPAEPLTAAQLQEKLAVAEARLEEKDSFIGRQSGEVGELRQAIAEMQQQLAAPAAPQVTLSPVTQADIDNDPAEAAQRALAQGDESALHRSFDVWREIDPFTASTWLNDRKLEQQQKAFEAKIAEQQKQFETATAPLAAATAQSVEQQQWAAAFDEVKATRPDFIENAPRLLEEVAPQYPSFLPALQSGDAKAKAEALAALYALDKMGNPQAVQAQLAEAAEEAAAEAAAARTAAGAVTSQTTAGQSTELKTEEELEQGQYIARQRSKPSLSKGWTGRS